MNINAAHFDKEWTRKFGDEKRFALETTVRFGTSLNEEPMVRQVCWVQGFKIDNDNWYEFKETAYQTAQSAQFNGQRRSDEFQDMEAKTAFSAIWCTVNGEQSDIFLNPVFAEKLCPRLFGLSCKYFCVAIGTVDYGLRLLLAEDSRFSVNPREFKLSLSDFEIPLGETMTFLESIAKLYEYDWRDVLWDNYRAHW